MNRISKTAPGGKRPQVVNTLSQRPMDKDKLKFMNQNNDKNRDVSESARAVEGLNLQNLFAVNGVTQRPVSFTRVNGQANPRVPIKENTDLKKIYHEGGSHISNDSSAIKAAQLPFNMKEVEPDAVALKQILVENTNNSN